MLKTSLGRLRKGLGVSQEEVAEALGLTRQTLTHIESGAVGVNEETARKYEEAARRIARDKYPEVEEGAKTC